MSLVATSAIVLHAFDYLESSRVIRLLTRELGLQSVLARGARRTRGRVGTGVDLFAQGEAQLYTRPTRELQTLSSFDVTIWRAALAADVERFAAASAILELVMRTAGDEPNPLLFDTVAATLDGISTAQSDSVPPTALRGGWQIIASAGFAPALEHCAACHGAIPESEWTVFSHSAGGALCRGCERQAAPARRLPPDARDALRKWLGGSDGLTCLTPAEARAHQRLLREFVCEHLHDARELRAFAAWETGFGGTGEGAA